MPRAKAPKEDERGFQVLLNPSVMHERFPVLETILERFCHRLTGVLHGFLSVSVDISLEDMKTAHFGSLQAYQDETQTIGVFHAQEWDNDGLLIFPISLVRPMLDLALGGELVESPRAENTTYTLIDRHLIQRLMQSFLDALHNEFQPVTTVNFLLSHLESQTRNITLIRETSPCVLAHFSIQINSVVSQFHIIFPFTMIQPVRHLLSEAFLGEKLGHDSLWKEHMEEELPKTHITLQAVLGDRQVPLKDVMSWTKGTIYPLTISPDSAIEVRCRGEAVFSAKMGRKQGNLALSVEDIFLKP